MDSRMRPNRPEADGCPRCAVATGSAFSSRHSDQPAREKDSTGGNRDQRDDDRDQISSTDLFFRSKEPAAPREHATRPTSFRLRSQSKTNETGNHDKPATNADCESSDLPHAVPIRLNVCACRNNNRDNRKNIRCCNQTLNFRAYLHLLPNVRGLPRGWLARAVRQHRTCQPSSLAVPTG